MWDSADLNLCLPIEQRALAAVGRPRAVIRKGPKALLRLESNAMKAFARFQALFLLALLQPCLSAQTAQEQAILAPINAMFDGMAKRDAAAIEEPTLPGGMMVLMRDGKPTQMTFGAFAERVAKP